MKKFVIILLIISSFSASAQKCKFLGDKNDDFTDVLTRAKIIMLKGGILAGEPSILLSFDGKENTMKFMMSSFVNSGTIDTCAKSFFKFSENDITGLRSFVINKYLKSAVSSENPTHLLLN